MRTNCQDCRQAPWTTLVVAALLALYAVMALGASLNKGPSFDEEQQLALGYNIWTHHGFRMENANGDLIKRWTTLPYLLSRPHPVANDSIYRRDARPYRFGFEFFFQSGNLPEWLLLQGRAMNVLLGMLAGWFIFYCARELFGPLGGIFSLIFFVFSPHMLAFGGLVSTEISVCLTMLGAVWSVWRLLHRVTWGRLGLGLGFVSLLVLAKPSALVICPITFILIAVKLFSRRPLEWQLVRPTVIHSPLKQLGVFAGLFFLHGLVAWIAVWAHYDFRYIASPNPADPTLILTHYQVTDPVDPTVAAMMDWLQDHRLLPEGFLHGIHALLTGNDRRQAFLNGDWTIGGWRTFFLHTFWEKTSPLLIVALITSLVGWAFLRHSEKATTKSGPARTNSAVSPSFYEGTPYFVLIMVYFIIAAFQDVNIGHRHILPIYPSLYILGGGPLALVWLRTKYSAKILLTLLLTALSLESLSIYPNYLAYFSPFAGGPTKGYEHLVDSSLDWGMDLPGVKKWLDQNNPGQREPVFLAYFGTDSVEYQGIAANRLPCYPDWRPYETFGYAPGLYIISATLYESVYTATFGPWNTEYEQNYQSTLRNILAYEEARNDPRRLGELLKLHPQDFWDKEYGWFEKWRFGRLCAWLRHHRPTPNATVGHSILIWRLEGQELTDALLGPPAEIDDSPLIDDSRKPDPD